MNDVRVWIWKRELKRKHAGACRKSCRCPTGKCTCECKCPRRYAYYLRWQNEAGVWQYEHASSATTARYYQHVDDAMMRAAVGKLPA